VRRIYLLMSGATLALAACSTKKTTANDDFKKDIELASSSDGIAVGSGATNHGLQVVSAIERTAPAPKAPALSSRARKHHKASDASAAAVVGEDPATVGTPEAAPITTVPVTVDPAPPISPRPQPQVVNYPVSRGPSVCVVVGGVLGAVLRGTVAGIGDCDACDPRTDGRNHLPAAVNRRWWIDGGGSTMINQRFPGGMTTPSGTFPGHR
jgi:hypothetical protein